MADLLERVSSARTYLTAKIPFLGFLTLRMIPRIATEREKIPSAGICLDGTLYLNEEWCSKLTDAELRGLLCHEVMHPATHTFERGKSKDFAAFNVASDHAINLIILDFIRGKFEGSIKLPDGGCMDPKYVNMSAEEIYDSFPKVYLKSSGPGGKGAGKPNPGNSGSMGGDCRPDLPGSSKGGEDAAKGDESAQDRLKRDWQIAVVAAAQVHEEQKGRGSLPGALRIMIDEMLNPKVYWADIISRWLGENCGAAELTYTRPARRSESVGEVLIGRKRKTFPDVTILWDTSGSMNGQEKLIFPEIQAMCEDLDLSLRVIIIDTMIHADLENITEAEEIAGALKGGGGSDFSPAFERLDTERNDSVVIAFTDGWIGVPQTMPETLKGVIWVLMQHGTPPTKDWGQILRLDDKKHGVWE